MGNTCCNQSSPFPTDSQNLIQTLPNSTTPPKYIDPEGNPLPNAYKRYVKPPTTVGRQSIIVRNLYENEDVPDWIWATQNQGLLNSGHGNKNHHNSLRPAQQNRPYHENRNTYELIEGRFQGLQTVNLSKIQNKNITNSQSNLIQAQHSDTKNVSYSIPPTTFASPSSINTSTLNKAPTVTSSLKRTFSINDVPVVTSINANSDNNGSVQMSPFQMITQNNQGNNQMASRQITNQTIQPSGFSSNLPSVNNSIQRAY